MGRGNHKALGRVQLPLELEDVLQSHYAVEDEVGALLGGARYADQEPLFETLKGVLDRPDLRLIQESITLSAHS